jgi:hypothetical protein
MSVLIFVNGASKREHRLRIRGHDVISSDMLLSGSMDSTKRLSMKSDDPNEIFLHISGVTVYAKGTWGSRHSCSRDFG